MQALSDAAEALQERLSGLKISSARNSSTFGRGEEAWEQATALWSRELARWDQERIMWDEKERRLLDHIYQLQNLVLRLTSQAPPASDSQARSSPAIPPQTSTSEEPASPPPSAMPQLQQQEESQAVPKAQSESQPSGRPLSVLEQANQFMPPEPQPFQPDPPGDFAPLEVASDANLGDRTVESVRQSLQAAFSAVDNDDVLNMTFDGLKPPLASEGVELSPTRDNGAAQSEQQQLDGPPTLSLGSDDIFWMNKLHEALLNVSLFPEEEDVENWLFGESTVSAVLTFQAFNGLPETGIVNDATWEKLLGQDYKSIHAPPEPPGSPTAAEASYGSVKVENGSTPTPTSNAIPQETVEDPAAEAMRQIRSLRASSELENRKRNNYEDLGHKGKADHLDSWPVLREGDGGKSVHYLQIALEKKGFISDVDDQRWWFFGPSTFDCVLSFQACSYLPESGVVDISTWKALLGEDATPESLASLTNEFEDDLTDDTESVWLLGEQRWERRKKAQ